ncbi:MAG TPA: hypothetical protein VHF06_20670 [Pseudonocardiaceae bacterium]|jgi:hypothetical protein|nr:hypothetical protein [Pseudonocardiaceae bacterium]
MLFGGLPWQLRGLIGVALLCWDGYRLANGETGTGVLIIGIAGVLMLVMAAVGAKNQNRSKR